MKTARSTQTPLEFISGLQKSVLETSNPASLAALPGIFARDLKLYLNGQELGWSWLEQHMREVHRG